MTVLKEKSLEKLSNVAVIVVAVVVMVVLLRHEFGAPKPPSHRYEASRVAMSTITNKPSKLNVVLGISTVCHFCEQNMPFYKTLSGLEAPGRVALYTIFPQSSDEAKTFLQAKGVSPNGVISSPLSNYKIEGTPTLLLVDASGKVEQAWVGALDAGRQADVLNKIRANE